MTVLGEKDAPEAHVLVVPFPAQGHIIPILGLTHKLMASNPNLTITFLTTPENKHLISSHPSINPLILPLPHMPQSILPMMLSLSLLRHPITTWFHSHPSPPTLIISDMFCGWTQSLAQELSIRRLVFSPSGAFAFATTCFLWKEMPTQDTTVSFNTLPNSPVFPWFQISSLFRRYLKGDPDSEKIREWYTANFHSSGLLVNSFAAFEEPYFKFLREELGHDRVWAVGPLLHGNAEVRGGASSVSVNDVVSWLDQKEDGNVVYVSFGTLAFLSKEQTEAIRSALAKSGVHFIWSMKKSVEEEEEECCDVPCNEKGLVIRGWAPQVVILRHPAVGAFLTHCGWNSVLESVAAGVPMLAWPMTADQFVDAKLLVDEFKVAKRVCEGENTVPDSDLLSRVLAESVSGFRDETRRVQELKTAALEAVREGGSSDKDLRCFMERLLSPSQ